jgi:hypothetical protein
MPPGQKSEPKRNRRTPLPEDLARNAIAHEESLPGDKVRMPFRH